MNNAAIEINNMLESSQELQAAINGHYWELADESVREPFITYSIEEQGPKTKNGLSVYLVQIWIWAPNLTRAGEIYDLVRSAAEIQNFYYTGATTGYTSGEARAAFLKMDFNLNLRY